MFLMCLICLLAGCVEKLMGVHEGKVFKYKDEEEDKQGTWMNEETNRGDRKFKAVLHG